MSEIRANTVSNAAGTGPVTLTGQYAAKVWTNLQGVGMNVRDSFNTSSVTDNATGDYTFNFTSSMKDGNYSAPTGQQSGSCGGPLYNGITASSLRYYSTARSDSFVNFDADIALISVLGDLA